MKLSTKILAVAFVVAIALTVTTVASAESFGRNLTIGSTGADVMALQQFLNSNPATVVAVSGVGSAGMESSYFGGLTKAAVAKYQVLKGITPAVGYFGPITRAAVNANGAISGNFPAGCTSASGYSSVTGIACTALPSNGPCSGGALFNSATGASCTGTVTPSSGAGDITVTLRNSGTANEVLEGANNTKVLGFDVEADGSDVSVTSAKVQLTHTGATGSDTLSRYADKVSIILDGKVVGTVDAADFSESSDVYTRSIPISGAVVADGATKKFYVAFSADGNIDSTDLSTIWDVELDSLRFVDGSGAIMTETPGASVIDQDVTFESLSTTGDIELTISEKDQAVNSIHTVVVDDTADTNDVSLLSFTLGADGSDITVDTLSFGVASTNGGVTEIANDFRLMRGSSEVGTVTLDLNCSGGTDDGLASTSGTAVCIIVSDIDSDNVVISEGSSADFTLVADINDVELGFISGATLSVTLNSDVTLSSNGHVIAKDQNGDTLTATELSGSADSTTISFLSAGISVKTVSTSATMDEQVSTVATDDLGIYTVVFDVTAIENPAFIALGTATWSDTESDTGVNFRIQSAANSYAATTTGAIALADITRVSGGALSGEYVQINAGQTARFQLQVSYNPAQGTGTALGYRMYMYSVNSAATAAVATAQQILTPEVDYRTAAVVVGN